MNNKLIIVNIIRFFFLCFLQLMLFNQFQNEYHLQFFIYILFILMLPYQTPHWLLLTSSFAIGLVVDIYLGGLGLNAGSAVLAAFVRIILLNNSYFCINSENDEYPSFKRTGFVRYSLFAIIIFLAHHSFYFFMEAYSVSQIIFTLYLIVSTLACSYLMVTLAFLFFSPRARR